tara:strand:- start:467 stop:697 length:231 start_codon:yes stop_codon:yes gene_type:complete
MKSNAEQLYQKIESDPSYTKLLFRQALQDPQGALTAICEIGNQLGLPVTKQEVISYLSTLDDFDTKQWLVKARGGL